MKTEFLKRLFAGVARPWRLTPLLALVVCVCCAAPDLFAPPDPGGRQIRFQNENGRKYLFIRDIAAYYGMQLSAVKDGCAISSGSSRAVFTFDKNYGSVNGANVNYLFPVLVRGGDPLLSEQDFFLVIDPVLRNRALARQNIRVVMIDPGHGAQDNGASGRSCKEKDLTLMLSRKLRASLLTKGYSVILTRDADVYPSLEDRSALCKKVKPDLFISIHCNASSDKSISGVETYAPTPAGAPSTGDSKPGYNSYSGNAFDKNNYRLAFEIQQAMVSSTKEYDKGVKHARFYVIKNASCPAVLVETGFISNPSEEANLASPGRQSAIVSAITTAIGKYAAATK